MPATGATQSESDSYQTESDSDQATHRLAYLQSKADRKQLEETQRVSNSDLVPVGPGQVGLEPVQSCRYLERHGRLHRRMTVRRPFRTGGRAAAPRQGWPRRAEAWSRDSRLAPRAEMSDSSPRRLGASGLARSTRPQQASSAEPKHLHCPKQTSGACQHRKLLPPICCLSKHGQASQWLQDQACCGSLCGCAREQTSYAHTTTLKRLETDHRMPALHVHLIPCLRWHLRSVGTRCLVLKNSGLFLVCAAQI